MPPWLAIVLGLMVAGALALAFPYRSLEEQLARDPRRADPLQIAYLQTWLTVRGDRPLLRYLLARQLADARDYAGARHQLALLEDSPDERLRSRVLMLEIDVALREIRELDAADAARAVQLRALRSRLERLTRTALPADVEIELAQRAVEAGAGGAALLWFERLLARGAALPADTWALAAREALALNDPALSARLSLQAMAATRPLGARRQHFLAALRALQGANRVAEALAAAEQHLGPLAFDTETLEYLTRLALAANRPDIAQRFAQMMLKLSLLHQAIARAQAGGRPVPPDWLALARALPAGVLRTQAAPAPAPAPLPAADDLARTPRLPFDDARYQLAYEVFLANANLRDALAVARSAVRQAPGRLDWRLRLAQVADWSGLPALALEQWHAIARASGRPDAWTEVQRRAPALFDTDRWLEALLFAQTRAPDDLALLKTIVGALEARGEPDRALALLPPHEGQPHLRERLELMAEVAARAGRAEARRAALVELTRRYGAQPPWALALAGLHFARGDHEAAFAALQAAAGPPAPPVEGERDFWTAYAELARLTGRDALALRTYRRLIAADVADEGDYANAVALLEDAAPLEAAALAEAAFLRHGRTYTALQALSLRVRHDSADGVRAFLARLPPDVMARLEVDARFLALRASFRLADGDPGGAAADARRAIALEPDDAELRGLLLWSLIASRDAGALRALLETATARPPADGDVADPLAPAYAAGWLSLQQPRGALPWLRQLARHGGDPLWLLSWADALEQLGEPDLAWNARRHAWLSLRSAPPAAERARRRELDARLVSLAGGFADGDAARARFDALLADLQRAGGSGDAHLARELAVGWWIARGHGELAQAWLVARYADALQRPAWAQLSVALAHDDRAQLVHLLDTLPDWLPLADRIEAARRVGRRGEAVSVAHDGLLQRPDAAELQRQFEDNALASAAQASIATNRFRQRPLDETLWRFEGSVPLTPRVQLGVQQWVAYRDSTDEAQFVAPADADITRALSLQLAAGGEFAASVAVHQRDGLDTVSGAMLQLARQVTPRLRLAASAGSAQPATDSVFLRAGASRTLLAAGVALRLSHRDFAALAAESSRFESHAGEPVGRGHVLRFEVGHDLRTEYPDLSIRATATRLHYDADDRVPASMLPLLPAAARPGATAASLLPRTTTQFGLTLAAGQSSIGLDGFNAATRRAWRPYALLSLNDDRVGGSSYEWQLGAGGRLLGADHLSLAVGGGSGLGVQRTPFTQWGLRYRMAF